MPGVPPEGERSALTLAQAEWARCRPWIEAALARAGGTHTIEDVEAGIAAGEFVFFPGERSACVVEVIAYPRLMALNYWLIGGELTELAEVMEPRITAWAKAIGCSRVLGVGRRGFERAFRASGFAPAWWIISKEI